MNLKSTSVWWSQSQSRQCGAVASGTLGQVAEAEQLKINQISRAESAALQQGGPLPHWGKGDGKMTFRQRASPLCLCLCLQSIQANLVPTMGRSRESLLQSSAGNQLLALHCSGCRAAACGRRGHNNARHRYNREREVQGLHCFRYFSRQCKFEHNWTLCLTLASCHGQAGRSIEFSMTFLGVNVHTFTDSFLLKLS